MNLTTYQNLIQTVGISKLDPANKDAYNIVKEGSANFTDPNLWNEMLADADIKETYEMHVKSLQKLFDGDKTAVKKETPAQKQKRKAKTKETMDVIDLYKSDEVKPTKKTKMAKKPKSLRKSKSPKPSRKRGSKAAAVSSKKTTSKTAKKVVKKSQPKPEVKFPVTVKKLSKELQLIKRLIAMDGKRKTVKSITLLNHELAKLLKTAPDRKPVLNDMHNRLKGALAKAEKAGVSELDISLEKSFKQRLLQNASNPKPKMKVEYLAGTDTGKK